MTELAAIGGKNKQLKGNMGGEKSPFLRRNAPYFQLSKRDSPSDSHVQGKISQRTGHMLPIPGKRERWVL
ncbi:MAG: hypothetical protein CMQ25_08215 [Gammaproteobacteria bacterium]|nr:hypothetical protein [Gammaproteobacteria bacterium]